MWAIATLSAGALVIEEHPTLDNFVFRQCNVPKPYSHVWRCDCVHTQQQQHEDRPPAKWHLPFAKKSLETSSMPCKHIAQNFVAAYFAVPLAQEKGRQYVVVMRNILFSCPPYVMCPP